MESKKHYDQLAFSRNTGILSTHEMQTLKNKTVAIPGMGGVGGYHLINLIRLGVEKFRIADFDTFDIENSNRQYGAKTENFDKPKIDAMYDEALSINPWLAITKFPDGVTDDNIDQFLDGVDLILDGLDFFCFGIRRKIFLRAYEKGIPVITAAPLAFTTSVMVFSPGSKFNFDQYFDTSDGENSTQNYLKFLIGLSPFGLHRNQFLKNSIRLHQKRGASVNVGCTLASSAASTEAIKILLNKGVSRSAPYFIQYDLFGNRVKKGRLRFGLRSPWMKLKYFFASRSIKELEEYLSPAPIKFTDLTHSPDDHVPEEILDCIIEAGIRAPSGDNCQPWRFSKTQDGIELYVEPKDDQSLYNFDQNATLISAGAAIENMTLMATKFKLESQLTYHPIKRSDLGSKLTHVVSINFNHNDWTAISSLVYQIERRRTNRSEYQEYLPSSIEVKSLKNFTSNKCQSASVTFDENKIASFANLVYKYDLVRSAKKEFHTHLFKNIIFTKKTARHRRDGFHYKNLGLKTVDVPLFKAIAPWSIMKLLARLNFHTVIAKVSKKSARQASGLISFTLKDYSPESFIQVGRDLQKCWLELTRMGFSAQPFAMPGFLDQIYEHRKEILDEYESAIIESNREELYSLFRLNKSDLAMVIKFGLAKSEPLQGVLRKHREERTIEKMGVVKKLFDKDISNVG